MATAALAKSKNSIARCRAAVLFPYDGSNLSRDLVAGLSVAVVALPVGVAYTQLAGFNPAVGLYSSILPLVAYAIFGTSRQLIIGPDAATCALITPPERIARGPNRGPEGFSRPKIFPTLRARVPKIAYATSGNILG